MEKVFLFFEQIKNNSGMLHRNRQEETIQRNMHIYIYIYSEREREGEREGKTDHIDDQNDMSTHTIKKINNP